MTLLGENQFIAEISNEELAKDWLKDRTKEDKSKKLERFKSESKLIDSAMKYIFLYFQQA